MRASSPWDPSKCRHSRHRAAGAAAHAHIITRKRAAGAWFSFGTRMCLQHDQRITFLEEAKGASMHSLVTLSLSTQRSLVTRCH